MPNDTWQLRSLSDSNSCSTPQSIRKQNWNLGTIKKGAWTHFVVNAKWSYEADGLLKVWKDGVLQVNYSGPNDFKDENFGFIRFGIYKAWWKYQQPSPADILIAYYDDVKIAGPGSNYQDVAPQQSTSNTPTAPTNLRVGSVEP
jgi:hypothetical protein